MVVVEGKIKGKARPRVVGKRAFTPEETVNYENWVRINYMQQDNRKILGPIRANITAFHSIPDSYSKKRVKAILEGKEYPCKKPDTDNIAKIILDSLNGIAYKDDSQVVELNIYKKYTKDKERIEFELEEI
jgi:Holliday junction resolvase